jgi:predicted component of type VI protein secretion system
VLIDQDFGLPDFTHLMNGYSAPDVDEIQRDILQQVRSYETRLDKSNVVPQVSKGADNSLGFGLTAVFSHKNQEQTLSVNISIRDNGSVGVNL